MKEISPSILNADLFKIKKIFKAFESANIKSVHLDIMDGVFVPNISFGPMLIKQLSKYKNNLKFISHLMIINPERYIEDFYKAGSDGIIIHQEATTHLHSTLLRIKSFNIKAGVSINPSTPVSVLEDVLDLLDEVLIMSVNPGFGGQKFIEHSYQKIEKLVNLFEDNDNENITISIDGGVNINNLPKLFNYGVDVAIIGSAIFKNKDLEKTLSEFNKITESN